LIRTTEILGDIVNSKEEIENKIVEKWQRYWGKSTKSRRLFKIINNVSERLSWEEWNPSRGMVQFLSGHGPYKQKLYALGITNTPNCECARLSTPEHVVLECPRNQIDSDGKERQQIIDLREELNNQRLEDIVKNEQTRNSLDSLASRISYICLQEYVNRI